MKTRKGKQRLTQPLKLMTIFAHPDDESMGTGSTLARYAEEGVEISIVSATRGQRGWVHDPQDYPGPEALGKIREAELYDAARVLGVRQVYLLDYMDGDLDQAEPAGVIAQLTAILRRQRPQVVVTFGPDGAYGHPDHIAISQFATAAVVCSASASYQPEGLPPALDFAEARTPHQVSKLYYLVDTRETLEMYERFAEDLVMNVDGQIRRPFAWEEWAVTTRIEGGDYWRRGWEAVQKHASQVGAYEALLDLPLQYSQVLWGKRMYYRAMSLVNGGRKLERDLFEGLR
jgi:LmbE family N-acetylglucosaminyl deacetylase